MLKYKIELEVPAYNEIQSTSALFHPNGANGGITWSKKR